MANPPPVVSHAEALRATCQECGCTTGGGAYCYQHAPYTVWPLKDGSFRSDRHGRRHVWLTEPPSAESEAALAIPSPAPEPVDLRGDWNAHMDAVKEVLDAKTTEAIPSPDLRAKDVTKDVTDEKPWKYCPWCGEQVAFHLGDPEMNCGPNGRRETP